MIHRKTNCMCSDTKGFISNAMQSSGISPGLWYFKEIFFNDLCGSLSIPSWNKAIQKLSCTLALHLLYKWIWNSRRLINAHEIQDTSPCQVCPPQLQVCLSTITMAATKSKTEEKVCNHVQRAETALDIITAWICMLPPNVLPIPADCQKFFYTK